MQPIYGPPSFSIGTTDPSAARAGRGILAEHVSRVRSRERSRRERLVSRLPFAIGFSAVILHFTVSSNLLYLLGIPYSTPGGNPVTKLHPATYLLALASGLLVFADGKPGMVIDRLVREKPSLVAFLVLIPICAFYSIASVGISGAAVYIESYVSAGLLALVLESGSERDRRFLAGTVLGLCLTNVLLAGYEALTETHLFPIFFEGEAAEDLPGEFRGNGLYDHPLTGAMVTCMGTLLLLIMRPSTAIAIPAFVILMLGLLSFGGRTALVITILVVIGITLARLVEGLAKRRLSAGFIGVVVGGVTLLPPLAVGLVSMTGLGERILSRLYFDDSAEVRNIQWRVLDQLSLRELLFGVRPDDLVDHMFQIGLSGPFIDIENFWLLGFINLGAICFSVFAFALLLFLFHLGRRAPSLGWVLIGSAILIASTSSSLGRKGSVLCMLVACMAAASAYRKEKPLDPAAACAKTLPQAPRRGLRAEPVRGSLRRLTALPVSPES
jgi:hypothetical protein